MHTPCLLGGFVLLGLSGTLLSQPADKLRSGPQPGVRLPASFAPFNINGDGKDRPRCLITHFEHDPVILVFAREPADGKDGPLKELLKKLEEAVANHTEQSLRSFVVFLSPEARSSASDSKEQDPMKLVDEAMNREALIIRLRALAQTLKQPGLDEKKPCLVTLACYHESPKGYNLSDKAEVTIIFYKRQVVEANYAFAADEMKSADIDRIIADVNKRLKQ